MVDAKAIHGLGLFLEHEAGLGSKGYMGANQSVPAATLTKVILNREAFDDLGEFDTSTYRFTIQNTGRYLINANALFYQVADQKRIEFLVRKVLDGTFAELLNPVNHISGTQDWSGICASTVLALSAGDKLELWVYHNDSVARLCCGGGVESYTFMSVVRLK